MFTKSPINNFTLILRDIANFLNPISQKQKRDSLWKTGVEGVPAEKDLYQGRFEVLPSKAIEEDFRKKTSWHQPKENMTAQDDGKIATHITSENYQEVYLRQCAEEEAQKEEEAKEKTAAHHKEEQEKALKEAAAKKMADDYRYRVRELKRQIGWWEQQRGMGQYEETIIETMIYNLQYELNGIPPIFWT